MGITILSPVVEDLGASLYNSNERDVDLDGDVDMDRLPAKRPRLDNGSDLKGIGWGTGTVVPGEMVTNDPQWMR